MAQSSTPANPPLRLVVHGRIAEVTQRNGAGGTTYRTLLRSPAVDQYSMPGTFVVRSQRKLGKPEEEITVECDLLGYARTYDDKDGNSVRTAEHVLQAAA